MCERTLFVSSPPLWHFGTCGDEVDLPPGDNWMVWVGHRWVGKRLDMMIEWWYDNQKLHYAQAIEGSMVLSISQTNNMGNVFCLKTIYENYSPMHVG
jgi:hypothetical protein